jgi:Xaa-Pro dipeptidase
MDVRAIQAALRAQRMDGWLLCDFRNRDFLAYRVLGLDFEKLHSRRWYYFIPAKGAPRGLASAVEPTALDSLPGTIKRYLSWKDLYKGLAWLLGSKKTIAMQYSPKNNVPYISLVDAGTIELVKAGRHRIVSSADLLQEFVSLIDEQGYRLHKDAGAIMDRIRAEAFEEIGKAVRTRSGATEYDVQQYIMRRFDQENLTTYSPPMVGVNDHPADPHFDVTEENARPFKPGDTVLIDMWAKKNVPGGIYYDITWSGYIGEDPPAKYREIFDAVVCGRNAAIAFVQDRVSAGKPVYGWEVDDACRKVVRDAGYGDAFLHRTGHSIGTTVHGNGANIDNLETKDERRLLPGCCFSIEPGIYLAGKMAVRTEINMFIRHDGVAEVTGEMQKELVRIK